MVAGEWREPWSFEIAVADDLEALAARIEPRFLQREIENVDAERHLRLGNRRAAAIAAKRYHRLILLAYRGGLRFGFACILRQGRCRRAHADRRRQHDRGNRRRTTAVSPMCSVLLLLVSFF